MLKLNDESVTSLELVLPRYGVGTARITLAAASGPAQGDEVTLRIDDRLITFTVANTGRTAGAYKVLAHQGKNKLSSELKPRFYKNTPIERIVRDAIRDAGESVASVVAPGLASSYARVRRKAATTIDELLPGGGFWFSDDARVNAGVRLGATQSVRSIRSYPYERLDFVAFDASLKAGAKTSNGVLDAVHLRYIEGRREAAVYYV